MSDFKPVFNEPTIKEAERREILRALFKVFLDSRTHADTRAAAAEAILEHAKGLMRPPLIYMPPSGTVEEAWREFHKMPGAI